MKNFPPMVCKLVHVHDAWLVGGAAMPGVDFKSLKDWDVMVPYYNWSKVAAMIPPNAVPTTFGGWKLQDYTSLVIIDLWPGDILWHLTHTTNKFIWHPNSGVRLQKL